MNNSNANQSINEVSDYQNSNVVSFRERRGIQFLPSVQAYLDRVLGHYTERRWNGLDVVKAVEQVGRYFNTLVRIQFPYGNAAGEIKVTGADRDAALPTEKETADILAELAGYRWPVLKSIPNLQAVPCPFDGKADDRFDFYNADGEPLMVQFMRRVDGEKKFASVTYWDDGFRSWVSPPGSNPIYNVHLIKKLKCSTVFLHEGAKASRFAQEIADGKHPDHPWASEFANAVHLGWIGGALSADETDFSVLKALGVKIVYIVPDADEPGENAVPQIAQQIDILTFKIDLLGFGDGFDMADPMPAKFFERGHYIGPSFQERRVLATWATDTKVVPPALDAKASAKPTSETYLRPGFHRQWFYSTEDGIHVNRHSPTDIFDDDHLNRELGPFSDTPKLSDKLRHSNKTAQRVRSIDIWPGQDRVFVDEGKRHFNAWSKPEVAQVQGNVAIWHEFLAHFLPNEQERRYFLKWLYTLVARPEVRIGWGVLLQSGQTGTGKSTIGKIATKLVGRANVSFPTHKDVEGDFNGWAAFKKLAIFNEFYTGGSNFKISNQMKSCMTDDRMTYNEKFKVARQIRCFVEVLACSNSPRAIDLDDKDRRWFVPTVTEIKMEQDFWTRFHLWLRSGGIEAINFEAHAHGDYFAEGERPMRTAKHAEFVANSHSEIHSRILEFHNEWADEECWIAAKVLQEHVSKAVKVWPDDNQSSNIKRLQGLDWVYYGKSDDADRRPRYKPHGESGKRVTALASPKLQDALAEAAADGKDLQPLFDRATFLRENDLRPF